MKRRTADTSRAEQVVWTLFQRLRRSRLRTERLTNHYLHHRQSRCDRSRAVGELFSVGWDATVLGTQVQAASSYRSAPEGPAWDESGMGFGIE